MYVYLDGGYQTKEYWLVRYLCGGGYGLERIFMWQKSVWQIHISTVRPVGDMRNMCRMMYVSVCVFIYARNGKYGIFWANIGVMDEEESERERKREGANR